MGAFRNSPFLTSNILSKPFVPLILMKKYKSRFSFLYFERFWYNLSITWTLSFLSWYLLFFSKLWQWIGYFNLKVDKTRKPKLAISYEWYFVKTENLVCTINSINEFNGKVFIFIGKTKLRNLCNTNSIKRVSITKWSFSWEKQN